MDTIEPESNALNPLNAHPFKDLDSPPPKKFSNHKEMKAPILKKNVNNKNPFGKVVSLRNIAGSRNRKRDPEQPACFLKILGRNRKMIEVFQQITDLAEYDYPVHIYGETGTGKELVAEAIHKTSSRKNKPFVPINCGALPESIIESELFGHVKGSFSGAVRDRAGRFELADGGTIFLDEVAELSKYMQVKLLRFLQDGKFEKVGGEKTVSVNVRVISATNKDLKMEMKKNRFRDDLFYRINVVPIHLPPLCERKSDIPLLVDHFFKEDARKYNRTPVTVSDNAMLLLTKYKWPGNVRELQNAIQFAIVNCSGNTIFPKDLPMELKDQSMLCPPREASRNLDVENVKSVLIKTGGNKAKAARLLNVGRATLYRFFNDYPELNEIFFAS